MSHSPARHSRVTGYGFGKDSSLGPLVFKLGRMCAAHGCLVGAGREQSAFVTYDPTDSLRDALALVRELHQATDNNTINGFGATLMLLKVLDGHDDEFSCAMRTFIQGLDVTGPAQLNAYGVAMVAGARLRCATPT